MTRLHRLIGKAVKAEEDEIWPLSWAFTYFFCLLCAYYILRPVRDEMGIEGGVRNLQWVFTGTFVVMLLLVPAFGTAVARLPRRRLLPLTYTFFILNLLLFYALLLGDVDRRVVAPAFFIWVSVFNLFVVSVFWSFMADLFTNEQAKRLFGAIAAGGSMGAIVGPTLTATLSHALGTAHVLPVSMAFLALAMLCIAVLLRWGEADRRAPGASREAIGGGILAGAIHACRTPYLLGIGLFVVLYVTASTFVYFEQAHIIAAAVGESDRRTTLFALMDLAVNTLTVFAQLFVTARLVERWGLALTLTLVPALVALGFAGLALAPVLAVIVAFQILRRAGDYAVVRPAREVLFTVLAREDKYKSKNFIDTAVYRGGDAASGWAFAGLSGLGLSLSAIAAVAVPVAGLWAITGLLLGRKQEQLRIRTALSAEHTDSLSS